MHGKPTVTHGGSPQKLSQLQTRTHTHRPRRGSFVLPTNLHESSRIRIASSHSCRFVKIRGLISFLHSRVPRTLPVRFQRPNRRAPPKREHVPAGAVFQSEFLVVATDAFA